MRCNKSFVLMGLMGVLLLSACASDPPPPPEPPKPAAPTLPDWVMSPESQIDGGLAATECVKANATMSILKNKATTLARADLAEQIGIQVKSMDKIYSNLTETGDGSASGQTFESVSKQVTNQKLQGSRAVKTDYVETHDGTNLCVLVVLNPAETRELFDAIVGQAGRELSPTDDRVLYQEFKAHKAQNELEAEVSRQQ